MGCSKANRRNEQVVLRTIPPIGDLTLQSIPQGLPRQDTRCFQRADGGIVPVLIFIPANSFQSVHRRGSCGRYSDCKWDDCSRKAQAPRPQLTPFSISSRPHAIAASRAMRRGLPAINPLQSCPHRSVLPLIFVNQLRFILHK